MPVIAPPRNATSIAAPMPLRAASAVRTAVRVRSMSAAGMIPALKLPSARR